MKGPWIIQVLLGFEKKERPYHKGIFSNPEKPSKYLTFGSEEDAVRYGEEHLDDVGYPVNYWEPIETPTRLRDEDCILIH